MRDIAAQLTAPSPTKAQIPFGTLLLPFPLGGLMRLYHPQLQEWALD